MRRARRQRRDLGRVEQQLGRDRRDEDSGSSPRLDRRHGPVSASAGASAAAGPRCLGSPRHRRVRRASADCSAGCSVTRPPPPGRAPPRRARQLAATAASSVAASSARHRRRPRPPRDASFARRISAPGATGASIRLWGRGVRRSHRPSLAYSLRATPRVARRNLVRRRTCGAANSLGLQRIRLVGGARAAKGTHRPEVFWVMRSGGAAATHRRPLSHFLAAIAAARRHAVAFDGARTRHPLSPSMP